MPALCPPLFAQAAVPGPSLPIGREAEWVAAARAGEEGAILQLLACYRPRLVRVLTGATGDPSRAEDLAQEAFLQAFRSLDQLRDPSAFYPWVRRIAMRRAVREARRAPARLEPLSEWDGAAADPAGTAETRLAVRAVLAQLPPDLRATLVLREMECLDYAEIAEALGVPVGTVRSRLNAARERFRKLWAEL